MGRKIFPTAADCELAFYDAFERSDLKLMMAVWSDEPDTICIHPQGSRLAGLSAIRDSFAEIFSNGAGTTRTRIKVSELRKHQGQTLAIHSVYESFFIEAQQGAAVTERMQPAPILATNIYALTPNGWRMIAHHASLSPQGTVAEEQGVSRTLH
jgi:ketosteroid isomerase-like protein